MKLKAASRSFHCIEWLSY